MIPITRLSALLMIGFLLTHTAGSHLYLTAFGSELAGVGYIASLPFVFAASLSTVLVGLVVFALTRRGVICAGRMPVVASALVGVAGCVPGMLGWSLGLWFELIAGLIYALSITLISFSWYELLAREGAGSVRAAVTAFVPLLVCLAVLEMTVGTLNVTALNGYSATMSSVPMWASTSVGAGLFLVILLGTKAPKSSESIYLRLFPVLMAVLGGCVVVGETLTMVTGVVMLVTYNLFTFSVSYSMFALSNERHVCAYYLIAVNLVIIKTILVMGLGIGLVIMNYFGGETSLTTAVVFSIYMLAMAAMVVQRSVSRHATSDGETAPSSDAVAAEDNSGRSIEEFGNRYSLTRRECEVFLLVARGWGARQISEELAVSENTVWSHIKHIYAKLGVQSKQEAINLYEGEGSGKQ